MHRGESKPDANTVKQPANFSLLRLAERLVYTQSTTKTCSKIQHNLFCLRYYIDNSTYPHYIELFFGRELLFWSRFVFFKAKLVRN